MSDLGAADVSRREQSKAVRRDAILNAARSLIREFGPEVSAERIAQRAGVSTATVYNLIGPRERLLGLLLSELFEDLSATVAAMDLDDPILFGDAVVVVSARMFIDDADLWRRIAPEVSGFFAASIQPYVSFQPINLQRHAMARAKALGMLSRSADPHATAMHIYAAYCGALILWSGGVLSGDEFLSQAQSGYWAVLAAFGSASERRRAQTKLRDLHRAAPMPGGGQTLPLQTGDFTRR
jgi:AcrR family transcriptional regulator